MDIWVGIIIGATCALYLFNKTFRHVVNLIIMWTLRGLLWVFTKIDGIGRAQGKQAEEVVEKTRAVQPREVKDKDTLSNRQLREIFDKNPDLTGKLT